MEAYRCPVCRGDLKVVMATNVVLHPCAVCRGIWLDREDAVRTLSGFIADKAVFLAQALDDAPEAATEPGGYRSAARSGAGDGVLLCPVAGCTLRPRPTSDGAEVIVLDACIHGAWFERGELARLGAVAAAARKRRDGSYAALGAFVKLAGDAFEQPS